MSADNYYLIRRHPLGGFACLMGFASDVDDDGVEREPVATVDHPRFETIGEAVLSGLDEYSEYGVSIHPECHAPGAGVAVDGIDASDAHKEAEPQ